MSMTRKDYILLAEALNERARYGRTPPPGDERTDLLPDRWQAGFDSAVIAIASVLAGQRDQFDFVRFITAVYLNTKDYSK